MVDEEKYTLNTSQKGHWYKCKNAKCELRIPLPDKIFVGLDANDVVKAECKSGHFNTFNYSEAGDVTKKLEVDLYFDIKDPKGRPKFKTFWKDD